MIFVIYEDLQRSALIFEDINRQNPKSQLLTKEQEKAEDREEK